MVSSCETGNKETLGFVNRQEDILSAEQFLASQVLCSMELNGTEGDILFIYSLLACVRKHI